MMVSISQELTQRLNKSRRDITIMITFAETNFFINLRLVAVWGKLQPLWFGLHHLPAYHQNGE